MIEAISNLNKRRKVVFNDSVILVDKNDHLVFEFDLKGQKVQFVFRFDDSREKFQTTLNPSDDFTFDLTLHRWYSTAFVESTSPWNLSVNGISLSAMFRVWASEKGFQRVFHLTVWENE